MTQDDEKKIILFLVEGEHDVAALNEPFKNVLMKYSQNKNIKLEFTYGDITSDIENRRESISHVVSNHVRGYCEEYFLEKDDILQAVLLLDMDGAYTECEMVQDDTLENTFYGENSIICKNPTELQRTHEQKRKQMDTLITLKKVFGGIPFRLYFMSCNLDHVICGNANNDDKYRASEDFKHNYEKNADEFIAFFNNPEIILSNDYAESWDAIRQGENSLKRYSNINIFLKSNLDKL